MVSLKFKYRSLSFMETQTVNGSLAGDECKYDESERFQS